MQYIPVYAMVRAWPLYIGVRAVIHIPMFDWRPVHNSLVQYPALTPDDLNNVEPWHWCVFLPERQSGESLYIVLLYTYLHTSMYTRSTGSPGREALTGNTCVAYLFTTVLHLSLPYLRRGVYEILLHTQQNFIHHLNKDMSLDYPFQAVPPHTQQKINTLTALCCLYNCPEPTPDATKTASPTMSNHNPLKLLPTNMFLIVLWIAVLSSREVLHRGLGLLLIEKDGWHSLILSRLPPCKKSLIWHPYGIPMSLQGWFGLLPEPDWIRLCQPYFCEHTISHAAQSSLTGDCMVAQSDLSKPATAYYLGYSLQWCSSRAWVSLPFSLDCHHLAMPEIHIRSHM